MGVPTKLNHYIDLLWVIFLPFCYKRPFKLNEICLILALAWTDELNRFLLPCEHHFVPYISSESTGTGTGAGTTIILN